MFGQSRIKQLEQQLEAEKQANEALLKWLDNLSELVKQIAENVIYINEKIDPKPIPTYNVDVINYTNRLKGFTKKKMCGSLVCQYYYMIPSWIIDNPNGNDLSKLDLSKLEIPPQMPPKRGGVMGM